MIVIDSSFWIEYFIGTQEGTIIKKLIEQNTEIIIPTIIITEVYKKFLIDAGESIASVILSGLSNYMIIDLSFDIALMAARVAKNNKLSLADSIIYATAKKFDATLYTLDKHFKDLPLVEFYEKK